MGRPAAHSGEPGKGSRGMRSIESDANEFDHDTAGHPEGKHFIHRRDSRFGLPEGRCRGFLAIVGTARHLAVAARTLRHLLWIRARFASAHTGLVIAAPESFCYDQRKIMSARTTRWIVAAAV
jgi:hypothetical protein